MVTKKSKPLNHQSTEDQIRPSLPGARLDAMFFAVGAVGVGYLIWVLVRETWRYFPYNIIVTFVVWILVAYLTLPRVHRILSSLYLPSYFLGRTRTSDGLLGDPVNLAFNGTARQLHQAMTDAGWVLADDITPRSAWGMLRSSLLRKSYPNAPVGALFLFNRRQDLAYQQEVNGSARQRHHLRVWRCPDDWPLPGGSRHVGWLGAGTYDTSVGISLFTLQVTHRIASDIDTERDYIVQSLEAADNKVDVSYIQDFSTSYHHRNGGGDLVRTDGALPVIDLSKVAAAPKQTLPLAVVRAATGHIDKPWDGGVISSDSDSPQVSKVPQEQRPASLLVGLLFVSLATLFDIIIQTFRDPSSKSELAFMIGIFLILQALIIWMVVLVYRGSARARMVLLLLCTISLLPIGATEGGIAWRTIVLACYVFALLALSSPESRRWVRSASMVRRSAAKDRV